jgi:hypothetical protein
MIINVIFIVELYRTFEIIAILECSTAKSVSRRNFSNSLFRIILIMVMCGTILRMSNREGTAIIALILGNDLYGSILFILTESQY